MEGHNFGSTVKSFLPFSFFFSHILFWCFVRSTYKKDEDSHINIYIWLTAIYIVNSYVPNERTQTRYETDHIRIRKLVSGLISWLNFLFLFLFCYKPNYSNLTFDKTTGLDETLPRLVDAMCFWLWNPDIYIYSNFKLYYVLSI